MTGPAARSDRRAVRALIERRRAQASALLATDAGRAALALHGTPLLLLDPETVRRQYRRLREALPFVRFHYAVKALAHDAVIGALDDAGCGFGAATADELTLLSQRGIDARRIIHTHPVKKPSEIAEAVRAGVRTFVVDNDAELAKFADAPADVRLLVRLACRDAHANSAPPGKFGVGPFEAAHLVARAQELGVRIAGFSFHVGSGSDDPDRFAAAATETLALMRDLEHRFGMRLDTLDIGGGFPVAYDAPVSSIEEVAASLRPVLEPHSGRLDILAEPGRVMVAESMTLVTAVVGMAERGDGRWYYLDDGAYGSYSHVIADQIRPLVLAEKELRDGPSDTASHRWATLGGPAYDSSDVIAREVLLPELAVGDLLVSPAMGAYTTMTAMRPAGRAITPVAVMTRGLTTGEVTAVGASDRRAVSIV